MGLRTVNARFVVWTILLWQNLKNPPPLHPVFASVHHSSMQTFMRIGLLLLAIVLLAVLVSSPAVMIVIGLIFSSVVLLAVTILNGSLLGLYWSGKIAEQVAAWQLEDRLELLELTPLGLLGGAWSIAQGVVQRGQWLQKIARIYRRVIGIVVILFVLVVLSVVLDPSTARSAALESGQSLFLADAIVLVSLVVVVWLDHIQSILMAVLIGLLVPCFLDSPLAARITAWLTFTVVQVIFYSLIFQGYGAAEQSLVSTSLALHHMRLLLGIFLISMVFLLRELLIQLLVHFLLRVWRESRPGFLDLIRQ
jgi:hypothetical protein